MLYEIARDKIISCLIFFSGDAVQNTIYMKVHKIYSDLTLENQGNGIQNQCKTFNLIYFLAAGIDYSYYVFLSFTHLYLSISFSRSL